jgi:hypothetical protein
MEQEARTSTATGTLVKPAWNDLTDYQREQLTKYEIDYHSASPEQILAIPPNPAPPPGLEDFVNGRGLFAKYPLTAEQVAAVNLVLDYSDKRPLATKLRGIGVTTTQYHNWKKNPHFANYMNERSEGLLGAHAPETDAALLGQVTRGNMRAIEYVNAMTGRYDPRAQSEVNVGAIMVRLVEVIQRHIKDPEIIRAIAAEFTEVAPSAKPLRELET